MLFADVCNTPVSPKVVKFSVYPSETRLKTKTNQKPQPGQHLETGDAVPLALPPHPAAEPIFLAGTPAPKGSEAENSLCCPTSPVPSCLAMQVSITQATPAHGLC